MRAICKKKEERGEKKEKIAEQTLANGRWAAKEFEIFNPLLYSFFFESSEV